MSSFADAFREIVVPDLRSQCRTQGHFVALEIVDFADAYAAILRSAWSRGAAVLSDKLQTDLMDWIGTSILRASDEAMPGVLETRAIADRVAADCDRYFAAFAAHQAAEALAW